MMTFSAVHRRTLMNLVSGHFRRSQLWNGLCLVFMVISFARPAFCADVKPPSIPHAAMQYRLTLKREAQLVWGLNAPVATFAAQVHQESRWRSQAVSPVGALGIAQFMPLTAKWLIGIQPAKLRLVDSTPLNPTWALRALVTYDRWLFERIRSTSSSCEHMAFVLSAYNGGLGWVYKRQAMAIKQGGNPAVCLNATCSLNPGVTPSNQRENERYPQIILHQFEPLYTSAHWGIGACT